MSDDAPAATVAPGTRRHPAVVTTLVAIAVVALDQLTKRWALSRLADGSTIDLVWTLRLNLAFNTGMAFSRGQGLGPFIAVGGLIVLVVLLVSLRHDDSLLGSIAAGLVIGGAAGNIIDRLFRGEGWLRGAVVDFIDLQWFPIFNLADAALTIGAVLILVSAMLGHDRRAGTS